MRSPTALVVALAALLLTASLGAAALQPPASPNGVEDRQQPPVAALEDSSAPWQTDSMSSVDDRSTATAASYTALDGHRSAVVDRAHPDPASPRQVIRIELTDDGDAIWTIESRYRLETQEEFDDFEAFAAEVTAGERDVDHGAEAYEPFVALAANATGREMELVDGGWTEPAVTDDNGTTPLEDATLENDSATTGVLAYRFTWTNFARTDGSRIYLGDAFRTDGGTWFQSLADGQRLVVEAPANYGYEDLPRTPEDGVLVWDGPHEFEGEELSVTYLQGVDPPGNGTDTNGSASGGSGGSDESTGGDPGEGGGFPSLSTAAGLLVLLVLVGAAGYYLARQDRIPSAGNAEVSPDAATTESRTDQTGAQEPDPTAEADAGADSDSVVSTYRERGLEGADADDPKAAETEGDDTAGDDTDADEEIDVELLSDEERVHRLLRRNDGRMKQVSIVSETGWSNAKVSQLLSEMDENDEIEKLRIGRENLITLPEVDPTEID